MQTDTQVSGFSVAALYRFQPVGDPEGLRTALHGFCRENGICGTLIVAGEGINGTVAGTDAAVAGLIALIEDPFGIAPLELKMSRAAAQPFHRMKVRLKREIVTMGIAGIDPAQAAGTYLSPREWDQVTADPQTIIIDTRNDYEVALGSFTGALDPKTQSFREFPAWIEQQLGQLQGRKIAMYCTGGIRCEKATAYVRSLGFGEVYHLKGGILKYLEEVPEAESSWRGECFVFDERVALTHGLIEGEAELCRACRRPLTPADRADPRHREGVSCLHCAELRSAADQARYGERHKQVGIAQKQGIRHIGG